MDLLKRVKRGFKKSKAGEREEAEWESAYTPLRARTSASLGAQFARRGQPAVATGANTTAAAILSPTRTPHSGLYGISHGKCGLIHYVIVNSPPSPKRKGRDFFGLSFRRASFSHSGVVVCVWPKFAKASEGGRGP